MYAIACVDNHLGLGYKGNLLISSKKDMKKFVKFTTNQHVIVGRTTFESMNLSNSRGRTFHVLTTATDYDTIERLTRKTERVIIHNDIESMIEYLNGYLGPDESPVVIGGGRVYNEMLKYVDTIFLTVADYDTTFGDAFFPQVIQDPAITEQPDWKYEIVDTWTDNAKVINLTNKYTGEYEFTDVKDVNFKLYVINRADKQKTPGIHIYG